MAAVTVTLLRPLFHKEQALRMLEQYLDAKAELPLHRRDKNFRAKIRHMIGSASEVVGAVGITALSLPV